MFWFKKTHSKLLLLTEENHCILIYISDDCSFSIMITFFYISKRKVFDYQTVYSNSNLFIIKRSLPIKKNRKTNCSPCNNFDGFTRNWTLWDEHFIQKKTYCVFLGTRRNLPLKSPTPILIDLHGMTHHGMTILYIQTFCVLPKFLKIPRHQFDWFTRNITWTEYFIQ